jgi:hypothetical protein
MPGHQAQAPISALPLPENERITTKHAWTPAHSTVGPGHPYRRRVPRHTNQIHHSSSNRGAGRPSYPAPQTCTSMRMLWLPLSINKNMKTTRKMIISDLDPRRYSPIQNVVTKSCTTLIPLESNLRCSINQQPRALR